MNTYIPCREENIFILGRTVAADPLPLFWTGSGIEFTVDGSELYIDFTTDYDIYEQWVRVEINGSAMLRTALPKGRSSLCVYRGMNKDNRRTVCVYKEVQPMRGDQGNCLLIDGIRTDGKLLYQEPKKRRLEFIGDSITSGEGLAGAAGMTEWCPAIFSTQEHYAVLTAKKLNADIRILSQSGWGTYCSWDNAPERAMPLYYEQICGVISGRTDSREEGMTSAEGPMRLGAGRRNDFSSWQPDAVIVNLGTNDGGAYDGPAWTEPGTGIIHKQRRNGDGSYERESVQRFTGAVYDFLAKLRKNNPQAYILWVYGMLGNSMQPYLEETIDRYSKDTGDSRVSFLPLPDTKPEWAGTNNHPGALSHQAAAKVLCEELSRLLEGGK